jgi:cytochrome P450
MVIKENMRIRPPVSLLFTRVAAQDVEFDGYKIPKGTRVGLGIEAVHSNPKYWPNPNEFIPERFASGKQHLPFTYLPFSLQTRAWYMRMKNSRFLFVVCCLCLLTQIFIFNVYSLGKHFSLVEQVVFIVTLLQHFSWTIHSCNVDEPYSIFLNKPKELKVKLQKIDPSTFQN